MAQLSDDTLANVFKALDKDGSQKLDKSEIRVLVENVVKLYEDQLGSEEKKNQEVEFLMSKFDANADGNITLSEFIEAYKNAKN